MATLTGDTFGSFTGKQKGSNNILQGPDDEQNSLYGDAVAKITDSARGGDDTLVGGNMTLNGSLGNYQLYAKLTDMAGIAGQTAPQATVVIDQTKPVPVMLDAIYNSATNVTTLTGTSEANSTVSIYDGTKLIGTAITGANGAWNLQTVTGNTIHSFTETATDLAGNVGASAGVTLFSMTPKQLKGGSGNDVLIGGPNNILTGGAGSDSFVFNPNFGKDTIKDFDITHDVIAFAQSLFPNGAAQVLSQTHDTKAGTVIVVDANDAVTLIGVTVAQLQSHASDIHFF